MSVLWWFVSLFLPDVAPGDPVRLVGGPYEGELAVRFVDELAPFALELPGTLHVYLVERRQLVRVLRCDVRREEA